MSHRFLTCLCCRATLAEKISELVELEHCPECGARVKVQMFPALVRKPETRSTGAVVTEGEAACFFHAGKPAVVPCDGCGRFLCVLCDLEVGGKHWCVSCLKNASQKDLQQNVTKLRTRYDRMVWSGLVFSLFLFPLAVVTATISLFLVIWKWRSPPSLVHRSRLLLILAIPVALLEIAASAAFWVAVTRHH